MWPVAICVVIHKHHATTDHVHAWGITIFERNNSIIDRAKSSKSIKTNQFASSDTISKLQPLRHALNKPQIAIDSSRARPQIVAQEVPLPNPIARLQHLMHA
jgi:hypothetical protein